MNVLVVGGGGREHALVWKLKQSPLVTKLYAAPGNGGISQMAECANIHATDIDGLLKFAVEKHIDFTVVGPDDPLSLGITDCFEQAGLKIFGPSRAAAILEYSKAFSKDFMKRHGVPTAGYAVYDNYADALSRVRNGAFPVVVKADGLTLGKGVYICPDFAAAKTALDELMTDKKYGASGDSVVIEDYLEGPEVTVLAFCDGRTALPMIASQDHKRVFDEDKGPNTGGMGAIAPCKLYTDELASVCEKTIFKPTVEGLIQDGRPFKGVIYFSLMLTKDGPVVIEYNARFGDPEAQALLPLLKTDLLAVMVACENGTLDTIELEWEDAACASIAVASGGYPLDYKKGFEINGLEQFDNGDVVVFHAGTMLKNGKFYTNGGRVLDVTVKENSLQTALDMAYGAIEKIRFEGMQYRTDIGKRVL